MAANHPIEAFLSYKLTFLKDRGDIFISAVGHFVNEIIAAGESWTENSDNKVGYLELCQRIDSAVLLLCEKSEEFTGAAVGVDANPASRASGKHSDIRPLTQATLGLDPPASLRQPAGTVASSPAVSHGEPKETDQSTGAYAVLMKPVLARISAIEKALCSLRSNADKAAGQQSGPDKQLKELLSKLSASDKKNKSSIKTVKEQISEISEISDTQVTLDQEQETRLKSLEKQLQKLSSAQGKLKVEIESQSNLRENLVHVPDQLESMKENLDVLKARIDRIVDDCNNKHHDIENVTDDLAEKVMTNTYTANVISEGQDKTTNLLQELETKFQTLEADSERNLTDVRKQVERGETNFRILCQMLNDRLTPLEQLRTCLNERAAGTEENIRKLSQVIQEVAVMSPRLQQLELKSSRTRCGFTTDTWFSRQVAGDTIKQYSPPLSNVGGNFNADSGIFTAPVDGLYVTSVSLYLNQNEAVTFSVRYKRQGRGQGWGTPVCWISSTVKDTTACSMGVVDMKAGDTLFLYLNAGKASSGGSVWFSCFILA